MFVHFSNRVIVGGAEFPAGEQEVEERFRPVLEALAGQEPKVVQVLPDPAAVPALEPVHAASPVPSPEAIQGALAVLEEAVHHQPEPSQE
jgi:hypothetical protein